MKRSYTFVIIILLLLLSSITTTGISLYNYKVQKSRDKTKFSSISNYDEYVECLKDYKYNSKNVNINTIRNTFKGIIQRSTDGAKLYYLYNIYLEKQYVLCETSSSYLIYDLMLNQPVEFAISTPSKWRRNQVDYSSNILIYCDPTYEYYSCDGSVCDVNTKKVVGQISHSLIKKYKTTEIERKENNYCRDMTGVSLNPYIITSDHRISNSYYFENFQLPYEYNSGSYDDIAGTCTLVALSILLGYYDTFYNDYLVPSQIIYYNLQGDPTVASTTIQNPFTTHDYTSWEPYLSNGSMINANSVSKDYHDYLVYLATIYNYYDTSNGMDIIDIPGLINVYPYATNLSCTYSLTQSRIDLIDSNIPFVAGLSLYDVYYYQSINGGTPILSDIQISGNHAVTCYGYLQQIYLAFTF